MRTPMHPLDRSGEIVENSRRDLLKAGLFVAATALVPGVARPVAIHGAVAFAATATTAKNVLIIHANQSYPGISDGLLNRTLATVVKDEMSARGSQVRETHIERGYDINAEVQKHLWADLIVTQSPVFWFRAPWIYKRYIDEVFTAGMIQQSFISDDGRTEKDPAKQYGSGGKLHGKRFLLSLTMNTPEEAFNNPEQHLHAGRSLDELFSSTTSVYKFCGFEILPCFGAFNVVKKPNVEGDIRRLKQRLASL